MTDVKPILTVSHYIYLTQEERYQLFDGTSVETIGISIPVWFRSGSTSEPAKEVFCRYYLSNTQDECSVSFIKEGYKINLKSIGGFNQARKLLDVKDKGCEDLIFKNNSKIDIDQKIFNVIHCVEIKPIELLLETMQC
jgi:hypothetical protein